MKRRFVILELLPNGQFDIWRETVEHGKPEDEPITMRTDAESVGNLTDMTVKVQDHIRALVDETRKETEQLKKAGEDDAKSPYRPKVQETSG
jgi:hypothetical protein